MRFCVNQSTIAQCSTDEFIRSCSRAGFRFVELRVPKLEKYLANDSKDNLVALLKSKGLRVVSLNSLEYFSLVPKENYEFMLKKAEEMMILSKFLNCPTIIVVPSILNRRMSQSKINEITAKRLNLLCSVAKKYQLNISFEFIGFSNFSVKSLKESINILQKVSYDNLSLTIDTFHFFLGKSSLLDLERLDTSKIFMIHVNDVRGKDLKGLTDSARVLPGKGNLNLRAFFKILKEKNYKGYVSVELFNKRLWKEEPIKVALSCRKSLNELKIGDYSG